MQDPAPRGDSTRRAAFDAIPQLRVVTPHHPRAEALVLLDALEHHLAGLALLLAETGRPAEAMAAHNDSVAARRIRDMVE